MNSNFVANFVNNLIKKTLSGDVIWNPLAQFSKLYRISLSDLFSQDEFHTIRTYESYYCRAGQGTIFLVSERDESGRDGEISEGYNLYIKPNSEQPISSVVFDTSELYRLKNAIELKSDLTEDVVDFMKSIMEAPEGLG